eukprot:gene7451-10039_t
MGAMQKFQCAGDPAEEFVTNARTHKTTRVLRVRLRWVENLMRVTDALEIGAAELAAPRSPRARPTQEPGSPGRKKGAFNLTERIMEDHDAAVDDWLTAVDAFDTAAQLQKNTQNLANSLDEMIAGFHLLQLRYMAKWRAWNNRRKRQKQACRTRLALLRSEWERQRLQIVQLRNDIDQQNEFHGAELEATQERVKWQYQKDLRALRRKEYLTMGSASRQNVVRRERAVAERETAVEHREIIAAKEDREMRAELLWFPRVRSLLGSYL